MRLRNEVRVASNEGGTILSIRAGSRAAKEVLEIVVLACIVLPLCALWGKGAFIFAALLVGYFFISALLAYLRCGIWVYEETVQVAAAAATNTASRDQVAGIGVLHCSGHPRFTDQYRQIALLLDTGQWFFSTGVWGRAEVISEAASQLSAVTGWPIGTSAVRSEAKSSLLPNQPPTAG